MSLAFLQIMHLGVEYLIIVMIDPPFS
jgi:hypothetical protein